MWTNLISMNAFGCEMCASDVNQNRKAARGIVPQVLSAGTIPRVPGSWHSTLSHLPESLFLSPPSSSFFIGFHYYGGGAEIYGI